MNNMKYFLTLICSVMLFAACNNDNEEPNNPSTKADRTVIVYMSAENNLTYTESYGKFLSPDLQEIVKGSQSLAGNQRLFVFVDSLKHGANSTGRPYIAEIRSGQMEVVKEYDTDFYASDPAQFQEAISWIVNRAPAESYGLVLWGHASGWLVNPDTIANSSNSRELSVAGFRGMRRAYGQDKGTDVSVRNAEKWMNITQMAKALSTLPKFEFIFADCCNMMCAEVGYELRNVTNYLIGAPAEIPGNGAPYDKIVPLLYGNGSQLYKNIIDTYYNYYLAYYKGDYFLDGYSVPLSVIDTKYMESLAQATNDILDKFEGGYPVYPKEPNVGNIVYYLYDDYPVMYDMRAYIKSNTSAADFAAWENVFKQAVPYYRISLRWMTIYTSLEISMYAFNQDESLYGCVNMFIPKSESSYAKSKYNYNKTCNNFGWNRAMDWSRYGWN